MADQNDGVLAQYGGLATLAATVAAAIVSGIASALNFRSRLADTEQRLAKAEAQLAERATKDLAIRDEARAAVRELADDIKKQIAALAVERDPSSTNIRVLVETIAQQATLNVIEPHVARLEEQAEKLGEMRERVSEVTGYVRGLADRATGGRS